MQKKMLDVSISITLLGNFGALLFIFLAFAAGSAVVAQADATHVNTFTRINEFVPKDVPVKLSDSTLFRSIDDKLILKFSVENMSVESLSSVQFLLLIVDEAGNIKSGQGWRNVTPIGALSSIQNEITLKYVVEKGNRVVVTSYEAVGHSKSHFVTPNKVFTDLSLLSLIKENRQFVKTLGTKLGQQNPCAPAQSAASLACKCGLKSFSCNPQTGAYSFTCFSQQENPSACPVDPPEN